MSKHTINGEIFYPWTDIKNRYKYYQEKYGKITLEKLEELVKEKLIESREIPVEGTPFTFSVYSEYGILWALGHSKFKEKINPEIWFK